MNETLENQLCERVLASKAGREVSPDVVLGAVRWALARYLPGEAEKAAKNRLHQLYGSYVGNNWLKSAHRVLDDVEGGSLAPGEGAIKLQALHGSTKERLSHMRECYDRIFAACAVPGSVLDIACGLNPLSFYLLNLTDISLLAQDAGRGVADVLNRFFAASGMPSASAVAGDALREPPAGSFDLALVMKFLPLAERMEKGGALRVLSAIDAKRIVVSFPTKSLSGRNVGMEKNYSQWFEGLGHAGAITDRFLCGNELFYVLGGA